MEAQKRMTFQLCRAMAHCVRSLRFPFRLIGFAFRPQTERLFTRAAPFQGLDWKSPDAMAFLPTIPNPDATLQAPTHSTRKQDHPGLERRHAAVTDAV